MEFRGEIGHPLKERQSCAKPDGNGQRNGGGEGSESPRGMQNCKMPQMVLIFRSCHRHSLFRGVNLKFQKKRKETKEPVSEG